MRCRRGWARRRGELPDVDVLPGAAFLALEVAAARVAENAGVLGARWQHAVVAERPDTYDRQWCQLTRRYRMLTAGLLQASGFPPLRARIVPAAAAMPTVFAGVVNLLANEKAEAPAFLTH